MDFAFCHLRPPFGRSKSLIKTERAYRIIVSGLSHPLNQILTNNRYQARTSWQKSQ
ncbi:hypothetical protein WCLP8_410001 [uncultured Gammaproteobacteria bacterium]